MKPKDIIIIVLIATIMILSFKLGALQGATLRAWNEGNAEGYRKAFCDHIGGIEHEIKKALKNMEDKRRKK